jgi:chromosome partitioning protein
MKKWAFISQKGGAGKTSLATQLGVYATQCGEKVMIFDMDVQPSCFQWYEVRGAGVMPVVVPCLPGKLQSGIDATAALNAFTMILIDTPPHTDKTAVEAIRCSEKIICPIRPSMLDVRSIGDTVRLLDMAGAKDRAIGVINCVHPGAGAQHSYGGAAGRLEALGIKAAETFISSRVAFVKATDSGKGVTETEPKGEAASEIQALWAELNGTAWAPVARPHTPAKLKKKGTKV